MTVVDAHCWSALSITIRPESGQLGHQADCPPGNWIVMLSLTGTLQVNLHVRLPLSTRGVPGCVGLRHGSTKAAKYVA
jgi:hypothetical protein